MPSVRTTPRTDRILAVCSSDWHLWHKAPVSRVAEPDWYAAMARPLREIRQLMTKYQCPLICAGDVFDRYDPPPELINFALSEIPYPCFAVPGQHDLPYHRLDLIKRSGYQTLVQCGRVRDLAPDDVTSTNELVMKGFPWGTPLTKCARQHTLETRPRIAVVHAYVWTKTTGHVGATEDTRCAERRRLLEGFDSLIFGDNHTPFDLKPIDGGKGYYGTVCNCGTLIRRKQDERKHKPSVGLLHQDGSITRHFLDCSQDKFSDALPHKRRVELEAEELLEELAKLGDSGLDFREAVMRRLDEVKVSRGVREAVLRALGE